MVKGTPRNQTFMRSRFAMLYTLAAGVRAFSKAIVSKSSKTVKDNATAATPLMPKKKKIRSKGGMLNQRQARKRARQGGYVKCECRLKQRCR